MSSRKSSSRRTQAPRTPAQALSSDHRRELVQRTAYFLSERHGFDPGRDVENWLEAERQVDMTLASQVPRSRTGRKGDAERGA